MKNKAYNMLVGLSMADALGVPVEFNSRESLIRNPLVDMRAFGTYHQPAGTWSDDSSLAFCLAESLCDGYDLKVMALKFVQWRNAQIWTPHGQVFDIGNQTREAISVLRNILMRGDFNALKYLKYEQDELTNGNGALMRILPLLYQVKGLPIDKQFDMIWEVSALTHGHIRSAISCLIYIKFAEYVDKGYDLEKSYECMKTDLNAFLKSEKTEDREVRFFDRLLRQNIAHLNVNEIHSSGYVLHTLEASFWCLLNTDSYLECVFKAINLGEDTDTTATVAGGIAGLFYGLDEVPEAWINNLARHNDIKTLSENYTQQFKL